MVSDLKLPEKNKEEYWIISIHWGDEYLTENSIKQKVLALQLVNAGFDLIVGHHPHVVQPLEQINESIVIYSYGNFIFDQNFSSATQKGLITKIDIESKKIEFYYSFQNSYKISHFKKVTKDNLLNNCKNEMSRRIPFSMKILMKIELLQNFYKVDIETYKFLFNRLLKRVFNKT